MKITVKKRGPKSYYDEFIYIAYFIKKFIKNPKARTHRMTHYLITTIIVVIAAIIVELLFYKIYKDAFLLFVVGLLTLLLLYLVIYLFMVIKRISVYKEDTKEVTFTLEEEGTKFETDGLNVSLKWENIKYIVVGKYSIVFVPVSTNYLINSVSIEYKNKIIEGLKKYHKEELLVNNTK